MCTHTHSSLTLGEYLHCFNLSFLSESTILLPPFLFSSSFSSSCLYPSYFFFFLFEAKVVSSNFRWAREFCMEKNLLSGNEWLIWPRASTGICTISYHVQCQSTLSNIPLGLYWLFGKILELVSLVSFLHVKILAFQMIFTGYSTEGNIKNSLKWNFGSILIWDIYSERKSP